MRTPHLMWQFHVCGKDDILFGSGSDDPIYLHLIFRLFFRVDIQKAGSPTQQTMNKKWRFAVIYYKCTPFYRFGIRVILFNPNIESKLADTLFYLMFVKKNCLDTKEFRFLNVQWINNTSFCYLWYTMHGKGWWH